MVSKQLFIFGNENSAYILKHNTFEKVKNNRYVNKDIKVFRHDERFYAFLEKIKNNIVTQQDYNNILRTNLVNEDPNYVREVTSYDIDKNIMCSIAKGSNFDEFFLEDKNDTNNRYSKLVYNLDDFREIDIKSFSNEYVVDTLITLNTFANILNQKTNNSYDNLSNLKILNKYENGKEQKYFILSNDEKNLLVSEEFVKNVIQAYYDIDLEDCLSKSKENIVQIDTNPKVQELTIQMKEQRRLFHEFVKESPTYLNNELLSNIVEPCSIVMDFTKNPIIGYIKCGAFILNKLEVESLKKFNKVYDLGKGLIDNLFEIKEELTKGMFQELVKKYIEDKVQDIVINNVPIKISDGASERELKNKELEKEESLNKKSLNEKNLSEIVNNIDEKDLNNKKFVEYLVERFSQYECSTYFDLDNLKKDPTQLVGLMQTFNFEKEELVNDISFSKEDYNTNFQL